MKYAILETNQTTHTYLLLVLSKTEKLTKEIITPLLQVTLLH